MSERPTGGRFEATVPDTLDLAERAELGLQGLANTLDASMDYEVFFGARFTGKPAFMFHETTGLPTNNPKYAESFPMLRLMTGSEKYEDVETGMTAAICNLIADDGLYYAPFGDTRPWHEGASHKYEGEALAHADFANVYGNSRALLALMARMQVDPGGPWRDYAEQMAKALARIAIKKEDYAYYPYSKVGEAFSYLRTGWRYTDEPVAENVGAEGSMFMYHCGPIRALSRWAQFTGDSEALDAASRLVRFVTKKHLWGCPGIPTDIEGSDRGYFTGHCHGHAAMLYALIEYAMVSGETWLKHFVREGYEFARHHGIPRIGAVLNTQPDVETCTISDMMAIAIKLTEAGMGDYYEDIEQMARNHLVESQLLREDFLREIVDAQPDRVANPPKETTERVIERSIGTLGPMQMGGYVKPYGMCCCMGNGTQALYYAWSKIIDSVNGQAKVNLLMNRVSAIMDVDSHLPYEGKVVLHNKTARGAYVRMPSWVSRKDVQARVGGTHNGGPLEFHWIGNYVVLSELERRTEIELTFPMTQETVTYTHGGTAYECTFKGNTLIDLSPRASRPGYPIYLRDNYRADAAPMKTKTVSVPIGEIVW